MQHSEQPYSELERARLAIEAMRQAKSLEDFEESWKEYLRRLERTWNKAESHFRKSPKWDSWHGPFKTLRRKDPLLAYFVNARGADEHTVGEITQRDKGGITVKKTAPGRMYIERLEVSNGHVTDLRGDNLVVEFRPDRIQLLPVTNRGVVYSVPRAHLSQPVDPENLLGIAEKGIRFYEDFLAKAEAFFILPVPGKT